MWEDHNSIDLDEFVMISQTYVLCSPMHRARKLIIHRRIALWIYFLLLIRHRIFPLLNVTCLNITLCFKPLSSLIRCSRISLCHGPWILIILLPFHPACTLYLFSFAIPSLRSYDFLSSCFRSPSIYRFILWPEWVHDSQRTRRHRPRTRSFSHFC
jgi:hypothetical protein